VDLLRYFAWPAVLLALNTSINNHYLRMKDGGSPSSGLMCVPLSCSAVNVEFDVALSRFAVGALIACYLPLFIPGL
jgi:Na+/serine symporter